MTRIWRLRMLVTGCWFLLAMAVGFACVGSQISNAVSFLDLGLGARPLALGNAFVAVADGIDSLLQNPAGLGSVDGIGISSSYETRWETFEFGHISAVSRGLGFSISYFDFGAIPETDREGNPLGFFSYQDVALLLGATVARGSARLVGDWGVGFAVKFVRMGEQRLTSSGRGGALDMGFLVSRDQASLPWLLSHFGFGVRLENIVSTGVSWGQQGSWESWPFNASIGASLELANILLIAFESDITKGLRMGIECVPIPQLALSAGVRHEGTLMWSLGMGLRLPRFSLDYAVVLHRHLSAEHRLTFTAYLDL